MENDDGLYCLWVNIFETDHAQQPLPEKTKTALLSAVGQLPLQEKLVTTEYFLEGKTYKEIAAAYPREDGSGVGVSISKVCSKVNKALRKLRVPPLSQDLLACIGPVRSVAEWAQIIRQRAELIAQTLEQTNEQEPMTAAVATTVIIRILAQE